MSRRLWLINIVVIVCSCAAACAVMLVVQALIYRPMCYAAAERKGYHLEGYEFDSIPLFKTQTDYFCQFKRIEATQKVAILDVLLEAGEFNAPRAECIAIPLLLIIGMIGGLLFERERDRKPKTKVDQK